jgi:acetoin utilization deacetylase AcuC-like enzyme
MVRRRAAETIANWLTRLRRRLTGGPAVSFVYHRNYRLDLQLPEYDTERALRILAYLQQRGLLRRGMLHRPRPASLRRLLLVHSHDYLNSLQHPGALDSIVGHSLDAEQQDSFLASQRAMVGGTLRATKLALRGCCTAVNLGGGLHHALPEQGSGFCAFNDVAVAIETFRGQGFDAPILTVDLDLHDGDGLRTIYADDPTVHTFSIHNRHLGPLEAVESTAVAVGSDVADADYLEVLRRELPPVVQRVRPDLVFYLAGGDPHVEDRMGDARLSLEGLVARDCLVIEELRRLAPPPPCVILLAGGYGPHAWRHGAAFFSWLLTGRADFEPPLELVLPLDQYRRLRRVFANPRRRSSSGRPPGDGRDAGPGGAGPRQDTGAGTGGRRRRASDGLLDDDWALTEADLGWNLGAPTRLFLDRFSRHGLELALEEAGILERLRAGGYRRLRVEIDVHDPLGDMLRVVNHEGEPLALLELKLRVDTALRRERRFLRVEWLLLQDAQQRFRLDRRLLPGQHYPGLGLLRDVSAGLIVLCERLELDGLVFVPAQYYIADRALIVARFLEPTAEARFRAVQSALRHLRLEEASAAVEAGRVRDAVSGEVYDYEPAPMLIPVAGDLADEAAAARHRRAVEAAGRGLKFTVVED